MIFIAHRGNIDGPSDKENSPHHIRKALSLGFCAEIDVWYIDGQFWLGHDEPRYKVGESFLRKSGVWCHAKHVESFIEMQGLKIPKMFWHQNDDFAMTSTEAIWVYPGAQTEAMKNAKAILVMPETINSDINNLYKDVKGYFGVCSDYVEAIKQDFENEIFPTACV